MTQQVSSGKTLCVRSASVAIRVRNPIPVYLVSCQRVHYLRHLRDQQCPPAPLRAIDVERSVLVHRVHLDPLSFARLQAALICSIVLNFQSPTSAQLRLVLAYRCIDLLIYLAALGLSAASVAERQSRWGRRPRGAVRCDSCAIPCSRQRKTRQHH